MCFKIPDLIPKENFKKIFIPSSRPTEISYPTPWDMCYCPTAIHKDEAFSISPSEKCLAIVVPLFTGTQTPCLRPS